MISGQTIGIRSAAGITALLLTLTACGGFDEAMEETEQAEFERSEPEESEAGTPGPDAEGTEEEEPAEETPTSESEEEDAESTSEDEDEDGIDESEVVAEGPGELVTFEVEALDWNEDVFDALGEITGHSGADYRAAAGNPSDYGLPADAPDLQGYLTPGEYRFNEGAEPEDLLQAMVNRTYDRLAGIGVTDRDEQHEVVTMASLIEDEAMPEQYPTVAGVIENRAGDGLLQIDTTVRYGLGDLDRVLTNDDRADASNPYNTYQHPGLPPGPITTPSVEALEAAADPEAHGYYYWTKVNPDTNEAKFAADETTHLQNAQEFVEYCEQNPSSDGC